MKTHPLGKTLVLFLAVLALPFAAAAQSDRLLTDIESRLRAVELQEIELESTIRFYEDSIRNLRSGEYVVFMGEGPLRASMKASSLAIPIPRVTFDWAMQRVISIRGFTPEEGARRLELERVQAANATRDFLAMAPKTIAELEQRLRQVKDEIAYLQDQRIRTRESLSNYNPVRNCVWRECACQWLADTCTGGQMMGTTLKSCEEWGGTYWHTNSHCGKGTCQFSDVCPMEGHWCCN